MKKDEKLKVVRFRWGYAIARIEDLKIVSIVSKIYSEEHRATQALAEGSFIYRTESLADTTEVSHIVELSDTTEEVMHCYIYLKSKSKNTKLAEVLRMVPVVLDIYYNIPEKDIESLEVHDGRLNPVNYKLNAHELRKMHDRINQYINVKQVRHIKHIK